MAESPREPVDPEPVPVNPEPEPVPVDPEDEPILVSPEEDEGGEDESISLVEDVDVQPGESKIRASRQSALDEEQHEYQRPLNTDGTGATRCRIFHSRIALAPLDHMQTSINDWIDGDNIEVKHVGHVIGTMEGKKSEQNLIVMVWY